jgi:uncharacterized LabA/DUF88 family protein
VLKQVIAFVDGENLVCRYQDMLDAGHIAQPEVIHIRDSFVWSPRVTTWMVMDLIRISYDTSVVGDDPDVAKVSQRIAQTRFESRSADYIGTAHVIPRVHKKPRKSKKTKIVDVAITMDVMRAELEMLVDGIYLLSGDADYLPLVREITRTTAKQVYVAAFSSGLAKDLPAAAEQFIDLDQQFFKC